MIARFGFPIAHWDGQVDHIHMYRTEHFEPVPEHSPAQLAADNIREVRWWSPAELTMGAGTFAPRALPDLISRMRSDGLPDVPIELNGF